jgi:zinc resistance-associated protein
VTAERDAAFAQRDRLQESAGELAQVEARLSSARVEYSRVVQGWAEAKARAGVVKQELATLSKRLDQAKDRVSQTGSIRQAEPPQRPAQKP